MPMEKKGSITVFLALILEFAAVACYDRNPVGTGCGGKDSDSEQYGYRPLFSVWTV